MEDKLKVSDVYQFLSGIVFALYLGTLAILAVSKTIDAPWGLSLISLILVGLELWLAAKGLTAMLNAPKKTTFEYKQVEK